MMWFWKYDILLCILFTFQCLLNYIYSLYLSTEHRAIISVALHTDELSRVDNSDKIIVIVNNTFLQRPLLACAICMTDESFIPAMHNLSVNLMAVTVFSPTILACCIQHVRLYRSNNQHEKSKSYKDPPSFFSNESESASRIWWHLSVCVPCSHRFKMLCAYIKTTSRSDAVSQIIGTRWT